MRLRRRASRLRDEAGVATVMALAMMMLLAVVAVLVAGIASLVLAQRRAQAAADLAALAGATAVQESRSACAASASVARRNGARVTTCTVSGDLVRVRVEVEAMRSLGQTWTGTGVAEAGPVGLRPS